MPAPLFFALVFTVRLFGLFSLIPLLRSLLESLNSFSPLALIYLTACYSLFQAIMQLPLAMLSDYYGRLKIIRLGLLCFVAGCIVCLCSKTFVWLIIGRSLQGAGAIGSTVQAMMADYAQGEEKLQNQYYLVGVGILLSLFLSFLIAPIFLDRIPIKSIFILNASLALVPYFYSYRMIEKKHIQDNPSFKKTPYQKEHWLIILTTFLLHTLQMFTFTVYQLNENDRKMFYLKALCLALIFTAYALRKRKLALSFQTAFVMSLAGLGMSIFSLMFASWANLLKLGLMVNMLSLMLLLEASLPTYMSMLGGKNNRGTVLGFYSTAQYIGMALGPYLLTFIPFLQSLSISFYYSLAQQHSSTHYYIYLGINKLKELFGFIHYPQADTVGVYLAWAPIFYILLYIGLGVMLFAMSKLMKITARGSNRVI